MAVINAAAPKVVLRFAPKPDKDTCALRDGSIDLEVGVLGTLAPEVRMTSLWQDTFVGAGRTGHPYLAGPSTAERYVARIHVVASRRVDLLGPVDAALAELGLRRRIVAAMPGHSVTLRIAAESDLLALVPHSFHAHSVTLA